MDGGISDIYIALRIKNFSVTTNMFLMVKLKLMKILGVDYVGSHHNANNEMTALN